jgi:hypothetical protein
MNKTQSQRSLAKNRPKRHSKSIDKQDGHFIKTGYFQGARSLDTLKGFRSTKNAGKSMFSFKFPGTRKNSIEMLS